MIKLMGELSKGEMSAQEKGWTDIAEVEKLLGSDIITFRILWFF